MKTKGDTIEVLKFQHHVFYVRNLEESKKLYTDLFDVQFSALNHPDSSAAMRIANQSMYFFSFGHYHHDICFVQSHRIDMDNNEMLHLSLELRNPNTIEEVEAKLKKWGINYTNGRVLKSASPLKDGKRAIYFADPNGHILEVIGN